MQSEDRLLFDAVELSTDRRVRRFRSISEKLQIVRLTLEPDASVAEVSRAHGETVDLEGTSKGSDEVARTAQMGFLESIRLQFSSLRPNQIGFDYIQNGVGQSRCGGAVRVTQTLQRLPASPW